MFFEKIGHGDSKGKDIDIKYVEGREARTKIKGHIAKPADMENFSRLL